MRQQQALTVMLSGKSVFLTGPPGAGKTYILNEFIRRSERSGKRVAVTASTGIAATHIGGVTIHTWSGLGIRDELTHRDRDWLTSNPVLLRRYVNTDVIVIDEVSMLHGKRLDMINEACKLLRGNDSPFGGMQVILVGDLFQLPPVNRDGNAIDFVYMSYAWEQLKPAVCYITEQHRQAKDRLLGILEAMRRGELEERHRDALQERLGLKPDSGMHVTRLYTHNVDVDSINEHQLAEIKGDSVLFVMETHGSARHVESLLRSVLAPERLVLKVGAEVMFVANNFGQGFVNGSRGRVIEIKDGAPYVRLTGNHKVVRVEPHSWAIQEDGKRRAEIVQLPIRLAWAITIHKSQGMSLDAAQIDLSRSFTPGMGYVALSRVRSIEGIFLLGMNAMAMRLHPDIFEFDIVLREASEALAAEVPDAPPEKAETLPSADNASVVPMNTTLFAKLKMWRMRRAQADGVPPYVVAHDALLEALCLRKPHSTQDLLGVPGIGLRKAERYGDELLAVLRSEA